MTFAEFKIQIDRLIANYGGKHFGTEQTSIIWNQVKELSLVWFDSVVTELIGSSRYAPLPKDFSEHSKKELDRISWLEKMKQESQNLDQEFFEGSIFSDEDRSWMLGMIKARMARVIPDPEWQDFIKILTQSVKQNKLTQDKIEI